MIPFVTAGHLTDIGKWIDGIVQDRVVSSKSNGHAAGQHFTHWGESCCQTHICRVVVCDSCVRFLEYSNIALIDLDAVAKHSPFSKIAHIAQIFYARN